MTTDAPIIAYDNLLVGATYTLNAGTEQTASPISDAATLDLTRPALPKTNASGVVEIEYQVNITVPTVFIMGAARHDNTAGYKTSYGTFAVHYWNGSAWVTLITAALSAVNVSTIYKLAAHIPVAVDSKYKYRLTYSGLTPNSTISIPELFLGSCIEMPFLDFGYDEYNDVLKGNKFTSLSGRTYMVAHYRRLEARPSWSTVPRSYDQYSQVFREEVIEQAKPFWWSWQPDTSPNATYMVQSNVDHVEYPILSVVHRSLKLDLVEAL